MFFSVTTSLLLIALLLASTSLSAPLFTTTIKTLVGDFVGLQVEYQGIKVDQFLGIPFGVIPNRFEVAQPAPEITNFVATKQPPGCIQANVIDRPNGKVKPHNGPNLAAPEESQSEDCLKLNIFRPNAPTPPGGYAVMFWIYGGAFAIGYIGGSKELNYYDGTSMAANQNVIIVEANYRLSVFGFPGADQIPQGRRNPGMTDVKLALEWVKNNIQSFGGDPKRVTVFGVSAGAAIVDELSLTQPALFRAAIIQSGSSFMVSGGNLITRNPAVHRPWSILANKTGCSDQSLSCLQQIPAQEIKRVVEENGLMFLPVFDSGMTVARNEMTSRKAIPMMIGSAFQDGLGAFPQNMDVESLINSIPLGASVRSQLVSSYKKGYTHGPGKEYTTPQYADAGFVTDLVFNCCLGLIMASPYQPATHVALNAAAKGNTLVYRYLYNATFDNLIWSYPPGVAHATEVPLVFGNLPPGSTPAQYALSNLMQTSWANFAKELNPGTGWVSILNSDGKANNEQDALNVLSVEAATRRQPVVERLMGNWGGAGRCYSLIDMTMGAVNLLPW